MSKKMNRITALLLDNLWFWAILAMTISLVYGAWALIEASNMHMPSLTPKGW
ncbi:MAG: hypothetical protein RQ952_04460 [Thermoproteota archaeon]|jgi:hypothetical protein|nr:hypothetical protein [Thermoproteota archaeon]